MNGSRYVAITRDISSSIDRCELTHLARQKINVELAHEQHAGYRECLRQLGAMVVRLPASDHHPDATFVEDTAVIMDEGAVICSMGTPSRRDEPESVCRHLERYRRTYQIDSHASIEGGDVLKIGRVFLIGRSTRTNDAGIEAFRRIVEPWGYSVTPVPVAGSLHLKTAVCALDERRCLLNPDWIDTSEMSQFELWEVPSSEPFAANILRIGNHIVVAQHHPRTAELLSHQGYEVTTVDVSELAKAEAGLTCLSLVFRVDMSQSEH